MTNAPSSAVRVRIDFAQASDPGRDPNKQVNEDSCGYVETKFGHLLVLCDGMGGHYGGKEASRTAITTIFEMMERAQPSTAPAVALKAAIEEAGRRVYLLGGPPENRTRPGSTVVSLLLHDGGMDVAHVGDSRGYIIRANQIYPLTRDHSMVQAMIDAGMLTEQQAIGHPDANKITRALGMKPEVEVEVRPEPMDLFAGDIVLLSSDGLTDLALAHDILGATRQALASGTVENACKTLIDLANNRGGHDNITVQMARVAEVPPKARATIPQAPTAAESQPNSAQQRPQETYPMTAPDQSRGGYATPPAAPSPAGLQAPSAQQWAPVPPTATDIPGHVRAAAGAGPTVSDQPSSAAQPWSGGAYQNPGGAQPGLAAYRIDASGPASLPLPPPAFSPPAPTVGPTQGPQTAPPMTPPMGPAAAGFANPQPAAAPNNRAVQVSPPAASFNPPSTSLGGYGTVPPTPARGGVVFVIIGMSVVIAILVIVLLWALFARG
ncbi:MAG: protein phosphatase 2C domain-containing protein [Polyangiaceae bacterium]|nr:protein phosphatase 2C domain-containing protein [Polyangiaceae bacterium]